MEIAASMSYCNFCPWSLTLLFDMLRALCGRFLTDFQFLKDFLENEVSQKYSVEWKRAAFFEFVRVWKLEPGSGIGGIEGGLSQDLRAKILQYMVKNTSSKEGGGVVEGDPDEFEEKVEIGRKQEEQKVGLETNLELR